MVFCCGSIEPLSPEEYSIASKNDMFDKRSRSPYNIPSNGNALIAGTPAPTQMKGHEGEHLVTVMVPEGVIAGQTIAVLAPDGSRLVKATIPAGLKSGETFLVRLAIPIRPPETIKHSSDATFPSSPIITSIPSITSQPQFGTALDQWTTPIDQTPPGAPLTPIVIEKPIRDPTQPSFVEALDRWLTPVPDADVTAPPTANNNADNNSITEYPIEETKTTTNVENQGREGPPVSTSVPIVDEPQSVGRAILIQDELPPPQMTMEASLTQSQQPPQSPQSTVEHPKDESESNRVMHVSGLPVNAHIEPATSRTRLETESLADTQTDNTTITTVTNQKLLLVHVPPGLPPGATMQVEIPGEDRTLAAVVPDGTESFHIAYTPRCRPTPSLSSSLDRAGSMVAAPLPPSTSYVMPSPFHSNQSNDRIHQEQQQQQPESPRGNKLLLVRVPPGTLAGTTLHVSVPDEPGRLLAAKVPPGNIEEFHVSYEARPRNKQQQYRTAVPPLPPAIYHSSSNAQQQQQHPYYHHHHQSLPPPPPYYNNQYHPYNNTNTNETWFNDNGMVVGGANDNGEYYEMKDL